MAKFEIIAYPSDIWTEDSGIHKLAEISDDGGDVYARFISEDFQKNHKQFDEIFSMSKPICITVEVLDEEE